MDITSQDGGIIQKTMELCQAVVEQPDFQALKQKLDAFMADELVKFQYSQLNDLGNMLQHKQDNGEPLKEDEIAKFDVLRAELMKNPVAQGYLDAQQELRKLHEAVGRFLNKTFEIGAKPAYTDVYDGSCSDCGSCSGC